MNELSQPRPYLEPKEWLRQQAYHQSRAESLLRPHWERRSRGVPHPVFDFLFEYYSFSSTNLKIWSPGVGVILGVEDQASLPDLDWEAAEGGVTLSCRKLSAKRWQSLRWMIDLLGVTSERPPRFGCHGLHEWAMVYQSENFRHQGYSKLRLSRSEIDALVERFPVCCTHFDAFRFFTEEARPLNLHQPTRENRLSLEQRGCLHVNMDLYKWASKFWPWVDSELMLDTFALALEARTIDMRASPYDLRTEGFEPIKIETEQGRSEYEWEQRRVAAMAQPLRQRLLESLQHCLKYENALVCT
jgi:hypothetical protein